MHNLLRKTKLSFKSISNRVRGFLFRERKKVYAFKVTAEKTT